MSLSVDEMSLGSRISRLDQLLAVRKSSTAGGASHQKQRLVRRLATRDALLDALITLYDECSGDGLKLNQPAQQFVAKYRGVVGELRSLRIGPADFEIRKTIGRGQFGQVHVVRQRRTGSVYAMKVLRKPDTVSDNETLFFEEERDIMSETTSPWLTSLYYAFQDAKQLYLVMEYHPGGDLMNLMERYDGCLDEPMSRFYLAEIVLALKDLHGMGYVHRDVKPDNVLLDRCGHVRLSDFGSAARLSPSGTVSTGMPVGTPHYQAPEILRAMNSTAVEKCPGSSIVPLDKSITYGKDCDYWALGVVAYEMLSGTTPFRGEKSSSLENTYQNILDYKRSLARPTQPTVSDDAWSLITGLLTDNNRRLDHAGLLQHSFFSSVNWNGIADMAPPFIPTLSGPDDTSHFDEMPYEPPAPSIDCFVSRQQRQFSGRQLPFIGFTYCKQEPLSSAVDKTRRSSIMPFAGGRESIDELEKKISKQRGQIQYLEEKLSAYEDGEVENTNKQLTQKLVEKNEVVSKLLAERDTMEDSLSKAQEKVAAAERLLEIERKDRTSTEKRALEIIQDMKRKWKREEEGRIRIIQDEVKRHQKQFQDLEERYSLAMEGLQKTQSMLNTADDARKDAETLAKRSEVRSKEVFDSSRLDMDEVQRRLERATADSQQQALQLQQQTAAHRKLTEQLQQQIQLLVAQNRRLEQQVDKQSVDGGRLSELRAERDRLGGELEQLRRQAEQLRNQLRDGDSTAAQLRTQNTALNYQLQGVQRRLDESAARCESRAVELSALREKYTTETERLLSELELGQRERDRLLAELNTASDKQDGHKRRISELETLLESMEDSITELEQRQLQPADSPVRQTPADTCQSATQTSEELERVQEESVTLRAQLKRVEAQLESVRDRAAVDRHKVTELQEEIVKKDKQLNDWKIDVRIANRETRTAEKALTEARQQEGGWEEVRVRLEDRLKQLQEELVARDHDLEGARRQAERRLDEKQAVQTAHQEEIARIEKQLRSAEQKLLDGAGVRVKLDSAERDRQRAELQLHEEQSRAQLHAQQLASADKATEQLRQQLTETRSQLDQKEKEFISLRDLCTKLDEQLGDMETAISGHNETVDKLRQEKSGAEDESARLRSELRSVRTAVNEERSLKLFQEKRADGLQKRLDELETETDAQRDILQRDLNEYRELSRQLTEQLSAHDAQLTEYRSRLRQMERHHEQLTAESATLKEDCSQLRTQISSLKDSGYKLSEALETAVDRAEAFKERVDELEDTMDTMRSSQEQTVKRYEDTLSQQTKLIDFLQAKTEAPPKKKTLTDRLFGESSSSKSKENINPVPLRYRELESMLERERVRSKQLSDQLTCARAEIVSLTNKVPVCPATPCIGSTPRSRKALRILAQSPGVQETPRPTTSTAASSTGPGVTPTPQRMHHNIPHRFDTGLMTRPAKCAACLGPVRFGRQVARCHECHVTAHPKCAAELPRTCGLPVALARHFSSSWQQPGFSSPQLHSSAAGGEAPPKPPRTHLAAVESAAPITAGRGWIRTPRPGKTGWDRRFLVVSASRLSVYTDEPPSDASEDAAVDSAVVSPTALQTLDLGSGHVHVDPDVAYSEVPHLARRDLPYVFKVSVVPATTCWPVQSHHFLCSSLLDKQRWVLLLESAGRQLQLLNQSTAGGGGSGEDSSGPARSRVLYTPPAEMDVNCVHAISEQLMLLGTEDGLYSLSLDPARTEHLVKVPNFPSVLLIKPVPSLNQLVFITGGEHELRVAALNAVLTCADSSSSSQARLETTRLEGLQQCHLVTAALTNDERVFICAASANRVCVFRWSCELVCYQLVKQFSTQEPATCLHITHNSIIIGTDRFFEVDLNNFTIEEFLDSSDASLSYIVYGTSQLRSFPVSILALSGSEYLLCFHELGVFVDQYGARSRKHDIKWTRLPLTFAYQAPFIYIFHFNAVEVIELTREAFTRDAAPPPPVCQLELPGARLLSTAAAAAAGDSGSVLLASCEPAGGSQLCQLSVRRTVTSASDDEGADGTSLASSWTDTDSAVRPTALGAGATADTASVTTADGDGSLEFSFTPSLVETLEDQLPGVRTAAAAGDTHSLASDVSSLSSASSYDNSSQYRRVHFNEAVRVRQHVRPSADLPPSSGDAKRRRH